MIRLTTADTVEIKGRGTVHYIEPIGENPRLLVGQRILLDGEEVIVRGVETFAVPDDAPSLRTSPFGILAEV